MRTFFPAHAQNRQLVDHEEIFNEFDKLYWIKIGDCTFNGDDSLATVTYLFLLTRLTTVRNDLFNCRGSLINLYCHRVTVKSIMERINRQDLAGKTSSNYNCVIHFHHYTNMG